MLITGALWVIFPCITMRKLRKYLAIKDHLGVEFISGYVAFNVSYALVFEKRNTKEDKKFLDTNFDAD